MMKIFLGCVMMTAAYGAVNSVGEEMPIAVLTGMKHASSVKPEEAYTFFTSSNAMRNSGWRKSYCGEAFTLAANDNGRDYSTKDLRYLTSLCKDHQSFLTFTMSLTDGLIAQIAQIVVYLGDVDMWNRLYPLLASNQLVTNELKGSDVLNVSLSRDNMDMIESILSKKDNKGKSLFGPIDVGNLETAIAAKNVAVFRQVFGIYKTNNIFMVRSGSGHIRRYFSLIVYCAAHGDIETFRYLHSETAIKPHKPMTSHEINQLAIAVRVNFIAYFLLARYRDDVRGMYMGLFTKDFNDQIQLNFVNHMMTYITHHYSSTLHLAENAYFLGAIDSGYLPVVKEMWSEHSNDIDVCTALQHASSAPLSSQRRVIVESILRHGKQIKLLIHCDGDKVIKSAKASVLMIFFDHGMKITQGVIDNIAEEWRRYMISPNLAEFIDLQRNFARLSLLTRRSLAEAIRENKLMAKYAGLGSFPMEVETWYRNKFLARWSFMN